MLYYVLLQRGSIELCAVIERFSCIVLLQRGSVVLCDVTEKLCCIMCCYREVLLNYVLL